MKGLLTILLCLGLLVKTAHAQPIAKYFHSFLDHPSLQNASIGFCIMNADDGKIIFNYHDSIPLIPASCLKIATSGAALGILGKNYRFRTTIYYRGTLEANGTLDGDIVILGGGDPTFGSDRWGEKDALPLAAILIQDKIISAGIKKITGKLIVDISHFDNQYCCRSWACDDTGNYFGAGASAFNLGENKYDLRLQTGSKPGMGVKILSVSPDAPDFYFQNCLITAKPLSGDQSNIYLEHHDSIMCIDGTIPSSNRPFTIKGAIPNPPAFAASYISEKLYRSGLITHHNAWEIDCGPDGKPDQILIKIDSIQSPELKYIVHYTNLNSINLYAECLLKETGRIKNGIGTRQSGISVVKKYWNDHGTDTTGLRMDDGCGLSKSDRISAIQLCKMLSVIKNQTYFPDFLESLPVAGQSGAMKGMGKGTAIDGKLYCKTGHIKGIRAYSGYFKDKSGKWQCFALIVNDYNGSSFEIHDAIEKLLIAIF